MADPEELVAGERTAFEIGVDQFTEEAISRRFAGAVDGGLEVAADGLTGGGPDGRGAFEVAGIDGRTDRVVAPLQEGREVLLGQPHQTQEDGRWERCRELLVEITTARVDEPVEEAVDQRSHIGLELCDPFGDERAVEQPAVARVQRRVHLHRDQWLFLTDRQRLGGGREHLRMTERPRDALVVEQVDAGHVRGRRARHRAALTQLSVGLGRIVGDAGFEQELGRVLHRFVGNGGFGHDESPLVVLSVGARARACRWAFGTWCNRRRPAAVPSTSLAARTCRHVSSGNRVHRRRSDAPGLRRRDGPAREGGTSSVTGRCWALRVTAQRPEWCRTLTSRVMEMNSSVRLSERGELPHSGLCAPSGPGYTYDCGTVPLGVSWRVCDRSCRNRLVTHATRTKVERQIP